MKKSTSNEQEKPLSSFRIAINITKAKELEAKLAAYNIEEKQKRADELVIADHEVVFQNEEKEKLQAELNKAIELLKKYNLNEL